jgi:hypothetical protein
MVAKYLLRPRTRCSSLRRLSQQEKNDSEDVQRGRVNISRFNSLTHKRTEGRAPVWGSEFTSKDAELQGGSRRNRSYAERKVVHSDGAW